jgi:hypothetical protein
MMDSMSALSTRQREAARKLATIDTARAYAAARKVEDPYFRCQALAWVARYAGNDIDEIVEAAFTAAEEAGDAFHRMSATAWPLRALVELGQLEQARERLQVQLGRFDEVMPDSSRSEAIFLVFQAVHPAGQEFWRPIFDQLARVCDTTPHWRTVRNLQEAILMIADEAPELASHIADRIPVDRRKRQLETQLAAGQRMQPRAFFWRG